MTLDRSIELALLGVETFEEGRHARRRNVARAQEAIDRRNIGELQAAWQRNIEVNTRQLELLQGWEGLGRRHTPLTVAHFKTTWQRTTRAITLERPHGPRLRTIRLARRTR
jgi:hypothetical protein